MPAVDIFFSYAHEDEELMNAVRRHLILFDRQGLLTKWYDREIHAGQNWRGQIDDHLRQAGIILLFVSPHFFESDYIYDVEMAEALRRHEAGEVIVIPIILRPCAWNTAPFAHLQAVPKDGRPITTWPNRDEACLDVANHIVEVVQRFDEIRNAQHQASSTAPRSELDEVAQTKPAYNDRPKTERDILLVLVQNSRCTDSLLSQKLNVSIERTRFHLEELEKDELIYGAHFYGGKPSQWSIAQEGRRYLNERSLLP